MAISKEESVKKVKLNLKGLTEAEKRRAKTEAGNIIIDGIQSALDSSSSPVSGGRFKRLKEDKTPSRLFEDGDLRAQISFEELDDDAIAVGIFENAPEVEKLKAFNHNKGDTVPQRRFIASPNQRFKDDIMKRVEGAIDTIRELSIMEDEIIQNILSDDLSDLLGE